MKIQKHGKDWCHICGKRQNLLLEFFYSVNSENDPKDESQYIRICDSCIFDGNQMLQTGDIKNDKK